MSPDDAKMVAVHIVRSRADNMTQGHLRASNIQLPLTARVDRPSYLMAEKVEQALPVHFVLDSWYLCDQYSPAVEADQMLAAERGT